MTELQSASGFTYTHFDCPECGEAHEVEGDFTGEFECDLCGCKFIVE
jgi:predicted RNA-binding Zn-ribbon protein involved in translation (DUF1610 family)